MSEFRNNLFYRTLPSDMFLNEARISLLRQFEWYKVGLLSSSDELSLKVSDILCTCNVQVNSFYVNQFPQIMKFMMHQIQKFIQNYSDLSYKPCWKVDSKTCS